MSQWLFVLLIALLVSGVEAQRTVAPTPPMGWNSWDSYGLTVTEQEFVANAAVLAKDLKKFGWQYAVVDEGWYLKNPQAKVADFEFNLDKYGRFIPVGNRFPSASSGSFRALAAKIHGMGLKFGIHMIRGIPREAVNKKLHIAGSNFKASDAADSGDTCPWNADNYGVKNNAAGQAYYDSVAKLYASWGVDYVKIDCISSHPYKGDEIRMFSMALKKTGRPVVLSLSPGPTPITKAQEVGKWADMWRISDDVWDLWKSTSEKQFPQDVTRQFQQAALWADHSGSGNWPDADMLPIGHLGPRPGNEKERESGLTHDEEQTLMTLWCVFRSPLIMGGNLTQLDDYTKGLLTNSEVLAVDQHGSKEHQSLAGQNAAVWISSASGNAYFVAVFNLGEETRELTWGWKEIGLADGTYTLRDLWLHKDMAAADKLQVQVARHGAVLLRVEAK
jgi:hypothetical protein